MTLEPPLKGSSGIVLSPNLHITSIKDSTLLSSTSPQLLLQDVKTRLTSDAGPDLTRLGDEFY